MAAAAVVCRHCCGGACSVILVEAAAGVRAVDGVEVVLAVADLAAAVAGSGEVLEEAVTLEVVVREAAGSHRFSRIKTDRRRLWLRR